MAYHHKPFAFAFVATRDNRAVWIGFCNFDDKRCFATTTDDKIPNAYDRYPKIIIFGAFSTQGRTYGIK